MVREVDTRDYSYYTDDIQRTDSMVAFAAGVSEELPEDHTVAVTKINPTTGTPASLTSNNSTAGNGTLISQALRHVQNVSPALGFIAEEPAEFTADHHVQKTSSGTSIVHFHQTYRGIPVFQMARAVHFSSKNELQQVMGDNAILDPNLDINPVMGVKEAILKACEFIDADQEDEGEQFDGWGQPVEATTNVKVSGYEPKIIAMFSMASQPTVLDKGLFADYIPAKLVIFHQGAQSRLGWDFVIALPEGQGQFELIVAADKANPGEILYAQETSLHVVAQGKVYTHTGANNRQMVTFPRPLSDYPPIPPPANLPQPFPPDWVDDDESIGNNTAATLGNSPITMTGQNVNGLLTFDPADSTGDDQKILNIFYFCNYMHDFFYLLGFDEEAGNFQEINFTGLGAGSDSVNALAHSGTVRGTANMSTSPDSRNPTMNMGLVVGNVNRHTAFDSDVVFHEFVHGVTNRLVGGRLNTQALRQPQSRGMGEGNSDYFALTVQNYFLVDEKVVTGDWVTDRPAGIRGFPYDENFPDGFGALGTGRYGSSVHNIGEIWCATLMSMTRHVVAALGKDRGYPLCWQMVVDGYKLSSTNPSFLGARDATLLALDHLKDNKKVTYNEYTTIRQAAWEAFVKFGMGINASSAGASLSGIQADSTLPADL